MSASSLPHSATEDTGSAPPPAAAFCDEASVNYMHSLLARALHQTDMGTMKQASEELGRLVTQPGFHSILQVIILSKTTAPKEVRWLASMYCKNNIESVWRRVLSDQERASFRATLLLMIDEEDSQIASQIAVVLGIVAKLDYPKEWPTLPSALVELLQASATPTQQLRVLSALHHVAKALQAKRTAESRAAFSLLSDNLFPLIFGLYSETSEQLLSVLQSLAASASQVQNLAQPGIPDDLLTPYTTLLLVCQLCTRVLRKLIINTTSAISTDSVYGGFLGFCMNRIDQYLALLPHFTSTSDLPTDPRVIFTRLLMVHEKCIIETQMQHPGDFIPFLSSTLQFFVRHILTAHDNGIPDLLQAFVLQALTFVVNVISCDFYNESPADKEAEDSARTLLYAMGSASELDAASADGQLSSAWVTSTSTHAYVQKELERKHNRSMATSIVDGFFSPAILPDFVRTLIAKYFRLTQDDMEAWNEAPEVFMGEGGGEIWKFSLRPCSEHLLKLLITRYLAQLHPLLAELIQTAHALAVSQNTDSDSILLKDSIYTMMGICANDLYHEVDFNAIFSHDLLPQFSPQHHKIVRRRAAWLVEQWVGIKMSAELRLSLYGALDTLLKDEDLVLKLQAVRTLSADIGTESQIRTILDDLDFDPDEFAPFLQTALEVLMALADSVSQADTKMKMFNVAGIIIDRCDRQVRPIAAQIAMHFHLWWHRTVEKVSTQSVLQSSDSGMLLCSMLIAFQFVVKSLRGESAALHPILYDVLTFSLDTQRNSTVILQEDALDLWNVALQNAGSPTSEIMALFPVVLPLIARNDIENYEKCLEVVENYLKLAPQLVFEMYGMNLVNSFTELLVAVSPMGAQKPLHVIDVILTLFPLESLSWFKPILTRLLTLVLDEDQEYDSVLAEFCVVFARLAIRSMDFLVAFLNEFAGALSIPNILETFISSWLNLSRRVPSGYKMKLNALGLLVLFARPEIDLSPFLSRIVASVANVYMAISSDEIPDAITISDDSVPDEDGSPEMSRMRQYLLSDYVYSTALHSAMRSAFAVAQQRYGQDFDAILQAEMKEGLLNRMISAGSSQEQ